jgi:hypothetical protein
MARSESRAELDSIVVNVELTLASIIQGVALYFLTDSARVVLTLHDLRSIIYVAAGLCVIFIFWSRSIIHTLTLIRWPLEFGHNFFYIACALGEAVLFTRLDRPEAWFRLSAIYAAAVWLLFVYDLRLIRARLREAASGESRPLYDRANADQWLNISLLIPLMFVFNVGCFVAIRRWPQFLIQQHGHFWLAGAQLGSFVVYLLYVARFFSRLAPLIAQVRAKEHA